MKSTYHYTIDVPVTTDEIRFTYEGQFNSLSAIWHVTLYSGYPAQKVLDIPSTGQTITITADDTRCQHFHAELILGKPSLTEADITKTIILLNQYKNLRLGVHQWG